MHRSIDPVDFAKVMTLPGPARRDLLEFLGSTSVSTSGLHELLGRLSGKSEEAAVHPARSS